MWRLVSISDALAMMCRSAAMWSADDTARGLAGFGSLVILPALGALAGAFASGRRSTPRDDA